MGRQRDPLVAGEFLPKTPGNPGGVCVVAFRSSASKLPIAMIRPLFITTCLGFLPLLVPAGVQAQFPGEAPKPPAPAREPVDPAKAIQRIEGDRFKLGAIEFNQKTREIKFPGKVNMKEGPLEYVLVHESGKVHESLLSTAVRPTELNIVLLLLNWKKSEAFFDFSQPERGGVPVKDARNPPASQIEMHVTWKDGSGKEQTCRVENWMHQLEKRAKVSEGPFIYTGSIVMPEGNFLAEDTGSIMALYVDPGSMINNPRGGNDLDDVWIPDPGAPDKDTPVTILLKPVPEAAPEKKPEAAPAAETKSKKR